MDGLSVSLAQPFEFVDGNNKKFGTVLSGIANILTLHPDDVVYVNHQDYGSRRRLLSDRLKFSYRVDIQRKSETNLTDYMGSPNYEDAMLQLFINVSGIPDLGLIVGPINVTDYVDLEEDLEDPEETSGPDATGLIVGLSFLVICCVTGGVVGFIYRETCANTMKAGHQKMKVRIDRRREAMANRRQSSKWTVNVPILNVRNSPSMNGEQIATKHEGDQLQIVEERPTNLYPNAKWLKFARPIRGHSESWVISNIDGITLVIKDQTRDELIKEEGDLMSNVENPLLQQKLNNIQKASSSTDIAITVDNVAMDKNKNQSYAQKVNVDTDEVKEDDNRKQTTIKIEEANGNNNNIATSDATNDFTVPRSRRFSRRFNPSRRSRKKENEVVKNKKEEE